MVAGTTFMDPLLAEFAALSSKPSVGLADVADLGKRLIEAGFYNESERCFEVCVSTLLSLIEEEKTQSALVLETFLYGPFIKTIESEENYYRRFSRWTAQLQDLGRKHQRPLVQNRDPKKLCFVLHTGVLLGHTEVMFRVIDSWLQQGVDCKLYVAIVQGVDKRFEEELSRRGIDLIVPAEGDLRPAEDIRDTLEKLNIQTAVWLSPPPFMSYALALKLAPRQVMWSVKFHPIWIPEVDVHLCGGHEVETTRNYNGHEWTAAPFPLTLLPSANEQSRIQKFRDYFPKDAVVLGSLAREEKLNSPAFLETLGTLMARNPRAHFIWTGRSQPQIVLSTFERFGIADRCHFVGWVDTNLYAEVLDIFLETFPFGCGITGFQAMSHGTPLLSFQAMDTLYGYQLHGMVAKQFPGKPVPRAHLEGLDILTAADEEHYLHLAQKLIDDVSYREAIGLRERTYFQKELDALPRYARRLWTTITNLPT
jgi:hypothetical protein